LRPSSDFAGAFPIVPATRIACSCTEAVEQVQRAMRPQPRHHVENHPCSRAAEPGLHCSRLPCSPGRCSRPAWSSPAPGWHAPMQSRSRTSPGPSARRGGPADRTMAARRSAAEAPGCASRARHTHAAIRIAGRYVAADASIRLCAFDLVRFTLLMDGKVRVPARTISLWASRPPGYYIS
jgi:hypothetical protein